MSATSAQCSDECQFEFGRLNDNHLASYLSDKSDSNIGAIRPFLYKNHIKTVVENTETENGERRWIFMANRFKSDFNNPISFECNGAIWAFSTKTNKFRPLVVPLPIFNSQKLAHYQIQKYIDAGEYTAQEVHDGTVVNLYHFQGSWRIATAKAYDATNLHFCAGKTYKEIFDEVVAEVYPEWTTDKLDVDVCYTLCIRHPQFHLFTEGCRQSQFRCILLQSVDLSTLALVDTDVGIARTKVIKVRNLNAIVSQLNQSIGSYKATRKPVYGYILRGKWSLGAYRCILFESALMSKIRHFMYNMNFMRNMSYLDVLDKKSTADKMRYQFRDLNSLRIFLQRDNVSMYLSLFPSQKIVFEKYHEWVCFLGKYVYTNMSTLSKTDLTSVMNDSASLEMAVVAGYEYNNVQRLNKLCALIWTTLKERKLTASIEKSKDGLDILVDFLYQPHWLDAYYSYLFL